MVFLKMRLFFLEVSQTRDVVMGEHEGGGLIA